MPVNRHRSRGRAAVGDDGASAVEFALVMPILVVVVFGIIGFGFVFAQSLALSNAAKEGARYGSVNVVGGGGGTPHTCASLVSEVRDAARTIGLGEGNVDEIKVTVTRRGAGQSADDPGTNACGDLAQLPCAGSSFGDKLTVEARYQSELVIPLVVVNPTFDLTERGVYQCEYR